MIKNEIDTIQIVNELLALQGLASLTDKRVSTEEEWYGPCPYCARQGSVSHTGRLGGEDRFRIHPSRPVLSPSGYNELPFFICRRCRQSGDLVQLVRDCKKCSFFAALDYLGIDRAKVAKREGVVIRRKKFDVAPVPSTAWQEAALKLVEESEISLYSGEYSFALEHLERERGLPGEHVAFYRLGYQPDPNRYDRSEDWGLPPGERIWVPRGIVIPEFHLSADGDALELWAVAIRRPRKDLELQERCTGKPANRYHVISGSKKFLYLGDAINENAIAVISDGQFDALSVQMYGALNGHRYVGVATQGSAYGETGILTMISWFARAKGILLCFDGDEAGTKQTKRMSKLLRAFPVLPHQPPYGKDLNDLHKQGRLADHLELGYMALEAMGVLNPSKSSPERQEMPLSINASQSLPTKLEEPFLVISKPQDSIPARDSTKCLRCGDLGQDGWCDNHALSQVFMENAETYCYAQLYVANRVFAGRDSYLSFAKTATDEELMFVLEDLYAVLVDLKDPQRPDEKKRNGCVRCGADCSQAYRISSAQEWQDNKQVHKYPAYAGKKIKGLSFCYHCIPAANLLEWLDEHDYPEYNGIQGEESWMAFVLSETTYTCTYTRDVLGANNVK